MLDMIGCLLILAFMTLTSESLSYVTVQKRMVGVDDQSTNLLITEKEEQSLGAWMKGREQSENG